MPMGEKPRNQDSGSAKGTGTLGNNAQGPKRWHPERREVSRIAKLVRHLIVNQEIPGSNPGPAAGPQGQRPSNLDLH